MTAAQAAALRAGDQDLSTSGPQPQIPPKTSTYPHQARKLPPFCRNVQTEKSLESDLYLELATPSHVISNPDSETLGMHHQPSLKHPKMRILGPNTIYSQTSSPRHTDRIREMGFRSVTPK